MYEAYYRLTEKPFNLTPDPKFLYLSDKHKEAFAHLLFGIKNRSGFVMVTGEIGTGKTTICRNLLNQLEDDTELAFIFNPALNPVELMRKINHEFGIDASYDNTLDLSEVLNAYLLSATAAGKNCVLVIDEAQNLSPSVLEQIRLLSNLETEKEKLLQIILIGQPELSEKLDLYELRQLNQRITARYHLRALNALETRQYIAYRIHVAGGRKYLNFTKGASQMVFKKSKGTPRVINAICDRALLIGYTMEVPVITPAIVKRAAHEVKGGRVTKRRAVQNTNQSSLIPRSLVYAMVVVPILIALLYWYRPERTGIQQVETPLLGQSAPGETKTPDASPEKNPSDVATIMDSLSVEKVDASIVPVAEKASSIAKAATENSNDPAKDAAPSEIIQDSTPSSEGATQDTWQAALWAADGNATREQAVKSLLHRWGKSLEGTVPEEDSLEAWQPFAKTHGLSADVLAPALDQLLAIGLPALLRLADGDKIRWCALQGVEEGKLILNTTSEEPITVARHELSALYNDSVMVLWKDSSPGASALLPGRKGGDVRALKERLRALKKIKPGNTTDVYDAEVASAVAKLQAETGLWVDGMAGRQVRMVLSSWLGDDAVPGLSPRETVQVVSELAQPMATQQAANVPAPEVVPPAEPAPIVEATPPVAEPDAPEVAPAQEAPPESTGSIPTEQPVAPRGVARPNVPADTEEQVQVKELDKPKTGTVSVEEDSGLHATTAPAQSGTPLVPGSPSGGQE